MIRPIRSFVFCIVVTSLLATVGAPVLYAAPTPPTITSTPAETPAASTFPSAEERLKQRAAAAQTRANERVWWNQAELVKALQLTDSQRADMDKLMAKALEDQAAAQRDQVAARQAFEAALSKGEWDAARQASADLNKATAALWGAQSDLKIDALKLLNETQRLSLMQQYASLIRRPWGVGLRPGGVHLRGGRGALQ